MMVDRLNSALGTRYRVETEIGEGGMATVFLAEDQKHRRKVALKVLKPELAAVVGAERFLAEIETTAGLQHPHILPLFDSGEADGFLFYVMPYVEGETLRDRLDRERQLPVDEAVRIARAVAQALQAAHDRGVIHRDVKPANVLLSRGEPLVADFGIALAVGAAGGRLTETGLSLGTPYYMSPEQATGDQQVGPRSDIYALGCVLYEMLVGEPPYPGTTAQAVLVRVLSGELTPPRSRRPTVPEHVDAVVRKALERLPADRFDRADDFARALGDPGFRHGGTGADDVARRVPFWTGPSTAFAGVAAVLALALAWSLSGREAPRPAAVERYVLSTRPEAGLTASFDLLPDGSGLVYQAPTPGGTRQLWVRSFDRLVSSEVPDTDGADGPDVSPDGTEVVFVGRVGELRVSSLTGGGARTLAESASCCPRWGPDGFIYFSWIGQGIRRIPAGGGDEEVVTEVERAADEGHRDFQLLPGGEAAVFTVYEGNAPRIEAIRLTTGERSVLTPGLDSRVTATGHLVFVSLQGDLLAAPFDAGRLELAGPAVPLLEGVIVDADREAHFDLSESGTLVYRAGSSAVFDDRELVWVARDGTETSVDPDWTETFWTPAISPDGSRLAVAIERGGGPDLYVKQLDRGPSVRLTFPDGSDNRPWWFPDGREILFISERGETRDAYRKRADGVGEAEVVLDLPGPVNQAFYSPDGQWLVYRTGRLNALDIFARRARGDTTPVPVADAPDVNEHSPTLSPDGRWLAYVSDESGRWELYVRPFPDVDGGRWPVSSLGATEPRWAPDGGELLYRSAAGEMIATRVSVGADGGFVVGASDVLFPTDAYYSYDFQPQWDVAPDGERFLMIRLPDQDETRARLVLVRNWLSEVAERVVRP